MKYTITIAHLERICVSKDQKVNHGDIIGLMGNTGKSDGAHVHIDCVEGVRPVRNYSLTNIYNGKPKSCKKQLDYCLEDLFSSGYRITTEYDEQEYFERYGWHHLGYDVVPTGDDWTVHYPRTFTGRVAYVGFNESYGNHVMIFFDILDDLNIEYKVEEDVEVENDMGSKYLGPEGTLYSMTTNHSFEHEYGQIVDLRYIKLRPENLGIVVGDARIMDLEYPGVNGTFFWYDADSNKYPTSILKIKDKILHHQANHYPDPQSILCYYQDGSLGIEIVQNASELKKPVWWAIGGVGLYDKDAEGFTGAFSDVWRKTNHMSIGYDTEGYIYLVRSYNVERMQTVEHMKKLGCVGYIGLDSGVSCQIQTDEWQRPSKNSMCRKVNTLIVAVK